MEELKFTKTHEWVKLEDDLATVGITEYAQKSLGDVVFVELPKKGKEVKQFLPFAVVESTKTAADVYAPLSGHIVEVNDDLKNSPQLVNEDPFGKGWLVKIKAINLDEINNLLDEASYNEFLKTQEH
ncbi:MAG: glycine cleavage system protein GcvH [Candidatus Omnitrophica bacterium]|nr:glycine cleavage system protein GcvH [Candidatus Omnitrophota bacterium]